MNDGIDDVSQTQEVSLIEQAPGDELIDLVANRLKIRLGGQMRDIRVSTCDGGLTLAGRIGTYYGKQMAQEVAMEVTGLTVHSYDMKSTQVWRSSGGAHRHNNSVRKRL